MSQIPTIFFQVFRAAAAILILTSLGEGFDHFTRKVQKWFVVTATRFKRMDPAQRGRREVCRSHGHNGAHPG